MSYSSESQSPASQEFVQSAVRRNLSRLAFLSEFALALDANPFKPVRFFKGGHAQTLAAYFWPRKYRISTPPRDQLRVFEVEPEVKVLAHCRWQAKPQAHPTVVAWHGMEGSTNSVYMIAIADKAYRAGFNVVRVNYRSCGGTEHLTGTLYHGGMSSDLKSVVEELISKDGLNRVHILGFSLGGNMVLKLGGEYGPDAPSEIKTLCVVSPSVDLRASTDSIVAHRNRLYDKNFIRSLKRRIRAKHKLYPKLYDLTPLDKVKTVRDFDELYTAAANGFASADDYYEQSSSVRVADQIRIPTLIIHSTDDPFIPVEPLHRQMFTGNPYILTTVTKQGGHVAFIANATQHGEDRFWAENRAVEFFKLAERSCVSDNLFEE